MRLIPGPMFWRGTQTINVNGKEEKQSSVRCDCDAETLS